MEEILLDVMRYELDNEGYILNVFFGCASGNCVAYTGEVPEGYQTLLEWAENANIRAYKIEDEQLVHDEVKDAELAVKLAEEAEENAPATQGYVNDKISSVNQVSNTLNPIGVSPNGSFLHLSDSYHGQIKSIIPTSEIEQFTVHAFNKNLLPVTNVKAEINGITFTPNADGTVSLDGKATADSTFYLCGSATNTDHIFAFKISVPYFITTGGYNLTLISNNGTETTQVFSGADEVFQDINQDHVITGAYITIPANTEIKDDKVGFQVEYGTEATDFLKSASQKEVVNVKEEDLTTSIPAPEGTTIEMTYDKARKVWFFEGESYQNGTPTPSAHKAIINTYPAGRYNTTIGNNRYTFDLESALRRANSTTADRIEIDFSGSTPVIKRVTNVGYKVWSSDSFWLYSSSVNADFAYVTMPKDYAGYGNYDDHRVLCSSAIDAYQFSTLDTKDAIGKLTTGSSTTSAYWGFINGQSISTMRSQLAGTTMNYPLVTAFEEEISYREEDVSTPDSKEYSTDLQTYNNITNLYTLETAIFRVNYVKQGTIADYFATKADYEDTILVTANTVAELKAEQGEIRGTVDSMSTVVTKAETNASMALEKAEESQAMLDKMADDDDLTPMEKPVISDAWNEVLIEYEKLYTSGIQFGVDVVAYQAAYEALETYITPILADMTISTQIERDEFNEKWNTYYTERYNVQNGIDITIRDLTATNAKDIDEAYAEINNNLTNNYYTAEEIENIKKHLESSMEVVIEQSSSVVQTAENLTIEFEKLVNNGVSKVTNTSFTLDDDGLTIAKSTDDFNAQLNNHGLFLYNTDTLIAQYDKDGAKIQDLTVDGTMELGYLEIQKVTVNGVNRTHIHTLLD